MAVSFTLMLRHILRHQLSARPASAAERRRRLLRFGAGTVLYPVATLSGLVSLPAMLACYALINGFYIFEQTPPRPKPAAVNPGHGDPALPQAPGPSRPRSI